MANHPRTNGVRSTLRSFGGTTIEHDVDSSFACQLRVDPYDNVIVGAHNIVRYLGISSMSTLWRYVEHYGLPAIKRPDGTWMTTMTAIDQWIFLAAELVNEKLLFSRGPNVRAQLALQRLQRQVDRGKFRSKQVQAALRCARGVGLIRGRIDPKKPYISMHRYKFRGRNALNAQKQGNE